MQMQWPRFLSVKKALEPPPKDGLLTFIEDEAEKTREHLDNLPDSCVPVWYRRNRKPPKERWCYVGRARVKGYGNTYAWWVYLHPSKDEWYFINKSTGQAYPMGSFREWTRHFYFEPLVRTD